LVHSAHGAWHMAHLRKWGSLHIKQQLIYHKANPIQNQLRSRIYRAAFYVQHFPIFVGLGSPSLRRHGADAAPPVPWIIWQCVQHEP